MLHRYIGDNTINPESKTLILGTIHPVYTDKFSVDFFYGNEATLWKIFNNAFPDELKNPTCKSCIKQFLECRGISISDVITVCERVPENSPLDRDIVHYEVNSALKKNNKRVKYFYYYLYKRVREKQCLSYILLRYFTPNNDQGNY